MSKLPPGSTIGILGGGQLGRMLAIAAAELGFIVHIFTPPGDNPAVDVAARHTIANWDDHDAVRTFAKACDVVTMEFENVPVETAQAVVDAGVPLRPGVQALQVAQDRVTEKTFCNDHHAPTVPFRLVDSLADLQDAVTVIGLPAILKTRRDGYDGKGQVWIRTADDIASAWQQLDEQPAILEGVADFQAEFSVIIARGVDGQVESYDPAENLHTDGILHTSVVPCTVPQAMLDKAKTMAEHIAHALDYVGVMGVEFFAGKDGQVLVNEFAPRVHNSGHWTQDGCATSQFMQHIRAVAGWPLADTARHSDVKMVNLIGEDVNLWADHVHNGHAHLHLYGKAGCRPGRKMGHVNIITP